MCEDYSLMTYFKRLILISGWQWGTTPPHPACTYLTAIYAYTRLYLR